MTRGALAYAHARMRAWKSRLFTRDDILPLLTAPDPAGVRRALAALGIEGDAPLQRLLQIYRTAIRTYPRHAPLFRALLRLHEVENVKLVWRTIANRRERNDRLWIDLGVLATVRIGIAEATTLRELVERLADSPYAAIAARVVKAHADDLMAAEAAFDQWAAANVRAEAARLPEHEKATRSMVERFLSERGRLPRLPSAFSPLPFSVATAVRVILLAEAELRGITALAEKGGDPSFDEVAQRVLARGAMGA